MGSSICPCFVGAAGQIWHDKRRTQTKACTSISTQGTLWPTHRSSGNEASYLYTSPLPPHKKRLGCYVGIRNVMGHFSPVIIKAKSSILVRSRGSFGLQSYVCKYQHITWGKDTPQVSCKHGISICLSLPWCFLSQKAWKLVSRQSHRASPRKAVLLTRAHSLICFHWGFSLEKEK